jgi:hypothetical protein
MKQALNCLAFERLLDEGAPDALPAAAMAQADGCPSCARSLARAHALEEALARHFGPVIGGPGDAPVPAGFADRVMARVAGAEARGVRWLALPEALPWWVRAAAEPGVALASVVAALVLWRGDALLAIASRWAGSGDTALAGISALAEGSGLGPAARALAHALVPSGGANWAVTTGLVLGLAPVVAIAAWGLWRAAERLVDHTGGLPAR